MSGLGAAALIAVTAWLGALTLVLVLVIRQIALVTARLDHGGPSPLPVYGGLMEDGPALGSRLPDAAAQALPEAETDLSHVLLLAATCTSCRELAEGLHKRALPLDRKVIALVPGRAELAAAVVHLLPPGIRTIRDPIATEVAESLRLERVPSALTVQHGVVTAKAPPLDTVEDLLRFMDLSAPSPNGNGTVLAQKGVIHAD